MAATVRIGGATATIDGYEWTTSNPTLKRMLDKLLDPNGPSGADPNPDHTAALAAIDKLGGTLVRFDEAEFDPNVKY